MGHAESSDRKAVFWAAPMLLGLVLIFGGVFVGAILLSSGILQLWAQPFAVYIPLAVGMLAASFWGARRASAHRFPLGMLVGLLLCGCLFLLGLTLQDTAFELQSVGIVLGATFAASLLGALLGAAGNKKRR